MLDRLARGDVVTVTRIDRLARNTFDLFGIVKRIVDAKAQFRSLAEPWADTAGRHLRELVGDEFEMAFDRGEVGTSLIDLRTRAPTGAAAGADAPAAYPWSGRVPAAQSARADGSPGARVSAPPDRALGRELVSPTYGLDSDHANRRRRCQHLRHGIHGEPSQGASHVGAAARFSVTVAFSAMAAFFVGAASFTTVAFSIVALAAPV
jgi:hypothetical protein